MTAPNQQGHKRWQINFVVLVFFAQHFFITSSCFFISTDMAQITDTELLERLHQLLTQADMEKTSGKCIEGRPTLI